MPTIQYIRESSGAVASEIDLVGVEKRPADWIQAVAGGAITIRDGSGTSVALANVGAGESIPGPIRAIVSSAGKVRYGTGAMPSPAMSTAATAAAASAAAAAASATAASFTYLDVTLIAGTKTQASGVTLTNAKLVGAPLLKTLGGSPGAQILAAISGNNVVLTSKADDGSTQTADTSTYTVSISGAA